MSRTSVIPDFRLFKSVNLPWISVQNEVSRQSCSEHLSSRNSTFFCIQDLSLSCPPPPPRDRESGEEGRERSLVPIGAKERSEQSSKFADKFILCARPPDSITSFARWAIPDAVIGAVIWLVRDTCHDAVIWLVRDTYPYATIWLVRATHHSTR